MAIFPREPPNWCVKCKGYEKNHDFQPISHFVSEMMQDKSHSYYGRRLGNRTQAFEWYQFEWPWVTFNTDFKDMILFNLTLNNSKTVYKIELYLQRRTNRKSYMVYRTAPFSTTLNDLYTPNFKVMPSFGAEYLRNATRYRHSFINRDLHMTYLRVSFRMILSDLECMT